MAFTIRITLHKTTKPVVSRLLIIPDDLLFEELHLAIEAAFDWFDPKDRCTSWKFLLCNRDPLKISNPDNYSGSLTAYYTQPNHGYEIQPALLHTTTPVSELFAPANMGYSRYWTYEYGISKYHHAIEVVQAGEQRQQFRGKIECVEQVGMISFKAWQFGDMRRANAVEGQTLSSERVDIGTHDRLERVQEAYQSRKRDEKRPFKRCKVSVPREMKRETSVVDQDERDLIFSGSFPRYNQGSYGGNARGVEAPRKFGQNKGIPLSRKRSFGRSSRGVGEPEEITEMGTMPLSSDEESCGGETIDV